MSRGSRLGIDTDTPRPAGLDDYPLVATPGWSSPAEIARASGNLATRGYGENGEAANAFQEAYASSLDLDLDLLRQYAELYAELTGTMLVPVGALDQTAGEFMADPELFREGGTPLSAYESTSAAQPASEEHSAAAPVAPDVVEEPNPVLFALGFLDTDEPF